MPANSDLTGGSALRARAWSSISVPFPRVQGCASAKSEYQYNLIRPKKDLLTLSLSLAPAEIIIALAYLLRNFKMSLRSKSDIGRKTDRFTLQYGDPGLQVTFKPRY